MLKNVKRLLDPRERKRFLVLIGQMILVALLEFAGIALVLPFIRFAGNHYSIEQLPPLVSSMVKGLDHDGVLVYAGICIFLLIGISSMLKIFLAWREQKFIWDLSHRLSLKQHRNILAKPYVYFIEKNSSEIITTLIVETSTTVRGVLLPLAQIISNVLVAILFLVLITFLHPKVSLVMLSISLVVGLIIIIGLKKKLAILGQKRLFYERSRFLQLKESILGIKTVKTSQQEYFFLDKFKTVSKHYSEIKPIVNTINSVPRFAMDVILFGGVVLLVTIIIMRGGDVSLILPSITFYVLVGFKLLPTFQHIINAIITIRFSYPSLKAVFEGLDEKSNISYDKKLPSLYFNNSIALSNCSFAHDENEYILNDVSLKILKGQKVGIVGYSGSGKSTLVEVLCGLLHPDKGQILVDGVAISQQSLPSLIELISFIPQDVFFFDDTLLKNITFQENEEQIDFDKLEKVLDLLSLTTFVSTLPKGIRSQVGEFGIKMSGGQKQRFGFARALYQTPKILILDESTSALDYISEKELLKNLREQLPELTIIKVAHRLKSVEDCDNIYFMDGGKITAEGTFNEILKNSDLFKDMVVAGTI